MGGHPFFSSANQNQPRPPQMGFYQSAPVAMAPTLATLPPAPSNLQSPAVTGFYRSAMPTTFSTLPPDRSPVNEVPPPREQSYTITVYERRDVVL